MVTKGFKSLIGLNILEASKKLGYWWVCTSSDSLRGFHSFERAAGGRIELRTENGIVVKERHNSLAEIYQKSH